MTILQKALHASRSPAKGNRPRCQDSSRMATTAWEVSGCTRVRSIVASAVCRIAPGQDLC